MSSRIRDSTQFTAKAVQGKITILITNPAYDPHPDFNIKFAKPNFSAKWWGVDLFFTNRVTSGSGLPRDLNNLGARARYHKGRESTEILFHGSRQ